MSQTQQRIVKSFYIIMSFKEAEGRGEGKSIFGGLLILTLLTLLYRLPFFLWTGIHISCHFVPPIELSPSLLCCYYQIYYMCMT